MVVNLMKINILFSSFISLASILENSVEENKADHFFINHDNQMTNRIERRKNLLQESHAPGVH